MSRGYRVQVGRADGITATFLIDWVEGFAKAAFLTHEVYGNTRNPVDLRLITSRGSYDEGAGYLGNVAPRTLLKTS